MYFIVLTTYQLFVSDVYARYLKKEYPTSIIKVFAVGLSLKWSSDDYEYISIPFLNGNKRDRILQRLVWGGRLFCATPIYSYFHNATNCNLFIFNDNEPITNRVMRELNKNKKNRIIIIEEGIGIYETTKREKLNFKQKIRLLLTWILGSPMQYKAIGESDCLSYSIVGDVDLYKRLNKAQHQIVIKQSKNIIYSQANIFLNKLGLSCDEYLDYRIIYMGQPINEYGTLDKNEKHYINILMDVFDKVLIKPHPRDAKGKYNEIVRKHRNCKVMKDELSVLPFESLIGALNVEVLISINSSAGVNIARTFPYIKSIFTFEMDVTKECIKSMDNGFAEINTESFESPYNNILIPKSVEELKTIMNIRRNPNHKREQLKCKIELEEMKEIVESTIDI